MANIISVIQSNVKAGPKYEHPNKPILYIVLVDGNPASGDGVNLPVGTFAIWLDGNTGRKFFKTGTSDTAWVEDATGPADGADSSAVHLDTADEFTTAAEKSTLTGNEKLLAEDPANSDEKRYVTAANVAALSTLAITLAAGNTTGGYEISGDDAAAASGLDGSPLIIHGGAGDGAGGFGALQASSYGNARGKGAIDLQQQHGAVTHVAAGDYSILLGGYNSYITATGVNSILIGGYDSSIDVENSIIVGGRLHNLASGASYSAVIGGWNNDLLGSAYFSAVVGGAEHTIDTSNTGIVGGYGHTTSGGVRIGMAGGTNNKVYGDNSFSGGGSNNTITAAADRAVILGGTGHINTGLYGAIIGGADNEIANGDHANVIVGSDGSYTKGGNSSVFGGSVHSVYGAWAVAVGGIGGYVGASSWNSGTFVGGDNSILDGSRYSATVGGEDHTLLATSDYSVIAGGQNAVVAGTHSFATGQNSHIGDYWRVTSVSGANITLRGLDATNGGGTPFYKFASGLPIEFKSPSERNVWVSSATTVASVTLNEADVTYWEKQTVITMSGTVNDIIAGDLLKANTNVVVPVGAKVSGVSSVAGGSYSYAGGKQNSALGKGSAAWGFNNKAIGDYSVVFGRANYASGAYSLAGGWGSVADGESAVALGWGHALGRYSVSLGAGGYAVGSYSFASGWNVASGNYSVAHGSTTYAGGHYAFSAGNMNNAGDVWRVKSVNSPSGAIIVHGNASATGWTGLKFTASQAVEYKDITSLGTNNPDNTWDLTAQTFTSATYNADTHDTTLTMSTAVTGVVTNDILRANANLDPGQAVLGYKCVASGDRAFATGAWNIASGWRSFCAGGFGNKAAGGYAFVASSNYGYAGAYNSSILSGQTTYIVADAYGSATIASKQSHISGEYAVVLTGQFNSAIGNKSFAAGYGAHAGDIWKVESVSGTDIVVIGDATGKWTTGVIPFKSRFETKWADTATSFSSLSYDATTRRTTITMDGTVSDVVALDVLQAVAGALNNAQFCRGYGGIASGGYSTSLGGNTIALGYQSTAIGYNTIAGHYSLSAGLNTYAYGQASISSGKDNLSTGDYSFVTGDGNFNYGDDNIICGINHIVHNDRSVVSGRSNTLFDRGNMGAALGSSAGIFAENGATAGWGNIVGSFAILESATAGGTTMEVWGNTYWWGVNNRIDVYTQGGGGGGTLKYMNGEMSAAISYVDVGTVYTDETTDANDAGGSDVQLLQTNVGTDDAFYFGGVGKFTHIDFTLNTLGIGDYTLAWEYYNGTIWTALSDVDDPSNGFRRALTKANRNYEYVTYTVPGTWQTTNVDGKGPFYYIRARVTGGSSTQGADCARVMIGNTVASVSYDPFTTLTTVTTKEVIVATTGFVAGNSSYTASGMMSVGQGSTVPGRYSFAAGYSNQVSGVYAAAFGMNNIVNGYGAFATGKYSVAESDFSFAIGVASRATLPGSFSTSGNSNGSTSMADIGQSQRIVFHLDGQAATTGDIVLDAHGEEIALPEDCALGYLGTLTMMNSTDNTISVWKVEGAVENLNAAPSLLGATETAIIDQHGGGATATVVPSVETGPDLFRWTVNSNLASKTIRWSLELTCSWVQV